MEHRHSKLHLVKPFKEITKEILKLNRNQPKTKIALKIGHNGLRKHLHNMEINAKETICRLYHLAEEVAKILHPEEKR